MDNLTDFSNLTLLDVTPLEGEHLFTGDQGGEIETWRRRGLR
jgi:hypothetical protein